MKKSYKFVIDKWAASVDVANYRRTIRNWIKDDGVNGKATLNLKDDIYVYATDKDVVHMVLTGTRWANLPSTLTNFGSDILDVIIDAIENRDVDADYDAEEELYNYLVD
jgi:hypothetical protein